MTVASCCTLLLLGDHIDVYFCHYPGTKALCYCHYVSSHPACFLLLLLNKVRWWTVLEEMNTLNNVKIFSSLWTLLRINGFPVVFFSLSLLLSWCYRLSLIISTLLPAAVI